MAKGGFPGMGGMNMQQMLAQAQRMQQDALRAQQELESQIFEAAAGGGMVSARVTGGKRLESLTIDPACVDPDDVEMLADLVVAAVNAALTEAAQTSEREMARITGGLNLGL